MIDDTLYANGINKSNVTVYNQPINLKIAFSNIKHVEIEESDAFRTTVLAVGLVGLAIPIITGAALLANPPSCSQEWE